MNVGGSHVPAKTIDESRSQVRTGTVTDLLPDHHDSRLFPDAGWLRDRSIEDCICYGDRKTLVNANRPMRSAPIARDALLADGLDQSPWLDYLPTL